MLILIFKLHRFPKFTCLGWHVLSLSIKRKLCKLIKPRYISNNSQIRIFVFLQRSRHLWTHDGWAHAIFLRLLEGRYESAWRPDRETSPDCEKIRTSKGHAAPRLWLWVGWTCKIHGEKLWRLSRRRHHFERAETLCGPTLQRLRCRNTTPGL